MRRSEARFWQDILDDMHKLKEGEFIMDGAEMRERFIFEEPPCCRNHRKDIYWFEYKVGDEVVYLDYSDTKREAEVFGRTRDENQNNMYAIRFKNDVDEKYYFRTVKEEELAYKKNKRELEKGDKFIVNLSGICTDICNKYEVVSPFKDGGDKYYSSKTEDGEYVVINVNMVSEVVYD